MHGFDVTVAAALGTLQTSYHGNVSC